MIARINFSRSTPDGPVFYCDLPTWPVRQALYGCDGWYDVVKGIATHCPTEGGRRPRIPHGPSVYMAHRIRIARHS